MSGLWDKPVFPAITLILAAVWLLYATRLVGLTTVKRYGLAVTGLVTVSLLGFAFYLLPFPSVTFACQSCHRAEYRTWMSGRHRGIGCYGCHSDGGTSAPLLRKLREVKMLGAWLRGESAAEVRLSDDACRQCHGGKRRPAPRSLKVRRGHALGQARCASCHQTHPVKRSPTHGGAWGRIHGHSDQHGCSRCHQTSFCARCHIKMPHSKSWPNDHGTQALAGTPACLRCHQRVFCRDCHRLTMPHPANWLTTHGTPAAGSKQACRRCHARESCGDCHEIPGGLSGVR